MSTERVLHVAALPFPTLQGTQAAVAAMMDALAGAGDAALLTYAHGASFERPPRYRHLRLERRWGDRSLRSGPSFPKLAQDAALAVAIARLEPEVVVAHHVEAALAALAARAKVVFVAHTALGPELPAYLPPVLAAVLGGAARRAGEALDVAIARRADAVVAVAPALGARIEARAGVPAEWLPIPWPVPPPIAPAERGAERQRVVLYAGNVDRYQGLEVLRQAMARLPGARLELATGSALEGEARRRLLHARADVVAVPRATPGGLPVKLLDAMARGAPVVAVRRATAGLALEGLVELAQDDDPAALAEALRRALDDPEAAAARAERARAWVARELSPARFLTVHERAVRRALDGARRRI